MKQAEYVGVVEADGHLSLPEAVRDQLHLRSEQVLRVTIVTTETDEAINPSALDCWRSMGRDAATGRVRDAAANHDKYLYGSRP